jgi:predicted Zn-ribbon and HTH transcriptional regulator
MDRVLSNDKEIMDLVAGLNVREFKKIVEKEDEDVTLNDLKIMSDIAEKSTKRLAIFGDKNDKPV